MSDSDAEHVRQVTRRRVIVRTLSAHETAAKMTSAKTFHQDETDNRSKHASRTSSMQWYTGFTLLIVPNQLGRPEIGKYVPETKSNGVSSAD